MDYPFNLKKMSPSGCLFDLVKLTDVSKNVISKFDAQTVFNLVTAWAEANDPQLLDLLTQDKARSVSIFNIDRETPKPRKDIAKWNEVRDYISYFFNEIYTEDFSLPANINPADAAAIAKAYSGEFSLADDKDTWFARIKGLCEPFGFTPNVKEFKQNPDAFKGHVGDVSTIIRVALTSRTNTPDLYSIMSLLGEDEIKARLARAAQSWS